MYYKVSDKYGKLYRKVSFLTLEAALADARRVGGRVELAHK